MAPGTFSTQSIPALQVPCINIFDLMVNGANNPLMDQIMLISSFKNSSLYPRDTEILGRCPAGTVLLHGEKVPL